MKDSIIYKLIMPNLSIKILSAIGAVIFWLLITTIADPVISRNFAVSVTVENEDAIKDAGKVYEIVSGDTANVMVSGKRSVVDKLSASDIKAQADMSDLSAVNSVAIKPMLLKKTKSDIELECRDVLKIKLEDMLSKQMKVTVVTEGTPADGYTIGDTTAKPNMVTVTGSKSTVENISMVKVTVNVDGAGAGFTSKLTPKAYDSNDNEVVSATLSFSDTKIKVKTEIVESKTIPVSVKVSGTPADGYEYVSAECVPTEIEVSGTGKKYNALSKLVIPIDITGATDMSEILEQSLNVYDYIDSDIKVAEEYETVSIKITIEKIVNKSFTVNTGNIVYKNLGDGLSADIKDGDGKLVFVLSGRESVLGAIPASALVPYIDCDGLGAGTHKVRAGINSGTGYSLVSKPTVTIKIHKSSSSVKKSTSSGTTTEPVASATPEAGTEQEETEASPTPAVT